MFAKWLFSVNIHRDFSDFTILVILPCIKFKTLTSKQIKQII